MSTTEVKEGSSDAAAAALATVAAGGDAKTRRPLADLIEQNVDELSRALPPGIMTADRFIRIVLTEFRKTPNLLLCTPESFLGALFQTAQLGLEPGGQLGHAFLIPYKNSKLSREAGVDVLECQLQIGYKGFVELGGRRGIIMRARELRENDDFDFDLGSDEFLRHKWKPGADRGEVVAFWGKAVMPDGKVTFTVMEIPEINERRDRSSAVQAAKRHDWMKTPWDTDYDAMARKTVIRAMVPQIALAPELQTALRADEAVVERDAKGDLSYLYRDAIEIGGGGVGSGVPTAEDVTSALNDMEDNHTRIACSKYIRDNFGAADQLTDEMVPAVLKIVQEWPAVLNRGSQPPPAQGAPPADEPPLEVDLSGYPEAVREHLEKAPRQDALDAMGWLEEEYGPDTSKWDVGEVAKALQESLTATRAAPEQKPASDAPQAAPPAEGDPGPQDPQGSAEAVHGVPPELLARTEEAIKTWSFDTVKQKLREWGLSATGGEAKCRLRLLQFLAKERAAGNQAVEALF